LVGGGNLKVLGISASLSLKHESNIFPGGVSWLGHDSAAALVCDGNVVAAIEEERLDRIKHSNKAPISAMKFCLESNNISIKDIDAIAVNFNKSTINLNLQKGFLENAKLSEFHDAEYYIHRMIKTAFNEDIDRSKIHFVPHHYAHAESVFALSGYKESLILVTDGLGDDCAGIILSREKDKQELLFSIPSELSLGMFYQRAIAHLGYSAHDEYKVMGLAPYGDPSKYKNHFNKIIRLLPDGKYLVNTSLYPLLFDICLPRRKSEPFTQEHKDIAAAIQNSLEEVIIHILEYYKGISGKTNLCLAGGVAHNCSSNGRILYRNLFDDIFVQPAAHDAGAALGAALYISNKENKGTREIVKMDHVYWGTDIGDSDLILKKLKEWDQFITIEKSYNITKEAANLIANGYVLGWVQGRSEFGPRALGNRSIIADPRPAENKHIINQMVKKREGYRPFAPSVLEENVSEYFNLPSKQSKFPFMNFVLKVKEEKRELLGAITHVDGTARVQTVSKITNPTYWNLINEFYNITGVPIVLNTSFNNNAEPIIDSVEDAIVCYLTTKLNYLIIGDYLISKKNIELSEFFNLIPSLHLHTEIITAQKFSSKNVVLNYYYIKLNYEDNYRFDITEQCYNLLKKIDGKKTINDLISETGSFNNEQREAILCELIGLWENRLIILKTL
jgi:carbamoyltransferase